MKRIISYIIKQPDNTTRDFIRIVLIDSLTIGLGFIIVVSCLVDENKSQDAATFGAILFIVGVLIRIWRRDLKSR